MISPTTDPFPILLGDFNLPHKRRGWSEAQTRTCCCQAPIAANRRHWYGLPTTSENHHLLGQLILSHRNNLCWLATEGSPCCKKCIKDKLQKIMSPLLGRIRHAALKSEIEVDVHTDTLLRALEAAMENLVPPVKWETDCFASKLPAPSYIDNYWAEGECSASFQRLHAWQAFERGTIRPSVAPPTTPGRRRTGHGADMFPKGRRGAMSLRDKPVSRPITLDVWKKRRTRSATDNPSGRPQVQARLWILSRCPDSRCRGFSTPRFT
ncbi:hypothetical protein CT0861_04417 [Colletotrichum tofieldiae]|uniref:Uncharacterized protein n=1 Tax=Colletotrichum tofieldiae TaxID=708197 RepID=A0A166N3Y5_9PEZI|nr:hypothetical protein CT0861_04417 [Colletotrichum tofieldiae]